MGDELRGFFFYNLRRLLVIFVAGCLVCACAWLEWSTEGKHTNAWPRNRMCARGRARAHVHPPAWIWGFGLGGVGLLISTVWPCLASCQCWASLQWLLWPPINQGQLLRWSTAASPPVTRRKGGKAEKPHPCFHSNYCSSCLLLSLAPTTRIVSFHVLSTGTAWSNDIINVENKKADLHQVWVFSPPKYQNMHF